MAPRQRWQQQLEDDFPFSAGYEDSTPTPAGWKRKLIPRIGKGMVAIHTDVLYITPSGQELKSRAQLQRYLKKNQGGPSPSEFIWIVDGTTQRSTRSKSAPMVKPLEMPSRSDAKRKSGTDVKEVGGGKRRHTVKNLQKPVEEPKVVKDNDAKSADVTIISTENDNLNEINLPGPVSSKKKRPPKGTINEGPSPAVTNSSSTNGASDASNKEDIAADTAKESSSKKVSKRNQSKGRSTGRKAALLQKRHAVNMDVSNANECDDNTGGEEDHLEEI